MRTILTTSLAFAALGVVSISSPANADSAVAAFRDTNQQPNGLFPAMNNVNCVVLYCIHNTEGFLNHQASTEALERAQNYNVRQSGYVSTH